MIYRVKPIRLGYSEADLSGFTYMTFPGVSVSLDIAFFLIQGAPKIILVDSGTWSSLMTKYWPGKTTDVQTFEQALQQEGLVPEDVDIIIQTHLHHDHCANTAKCKNAEVYVQSEEWAFACEPPPLQSQYYPEELLSQIKSTRLRLIAGDHELCPGVRILHTPGHTPGTQSICVETEEGRTVIAGMCSVYQTFADPKQVLSPGHPFSHWEVFTQSIATDLDQAYDSCLQLKRMADVLLPCHGPGFDEKKKESLQL
jgi:N-acyl homoserine lactone hydrolase